MEPHECVCIVCLGCDPPPIQTETASPAEMIVPRESMALAQRLVRENICTDFNRTYTYAMHRKGKWTGLSKQTDLDSC
jgi:hypothetical protein